MDESSMGGGLARWSNGNTEDKKLKSVVFDHNVDKSAMVWGDKGTIHCFSRSSSCAVILLWIQCCMVEQ